MGLDMFRFYTWKYEGKPIQIYVRRESETLDLISSIYQIEKLMSLPKPGRWFPYSGSYELYPIPRYSDFLIILLTNPDLKLLLPRPEEDQIFSFDINKIQDYFPNE